MRLLIAITGAVGAVEMPRILLRLRQNDVSVTVLMTNAARRFIPAETIGLFCGTEVFTDLFSATGDVLVPHIELPRLADLFVVMPASANIIGKAAHGICDDLVSTSIVASPRPLLFVPAMNETMWANAIVQNNVQILRRAGHSVLPPAVGVEVANAERGLGAMAPITAVLAEIQRLMPFH